MSRLRALPTANGSDGCDSTGATMRSSTIIASAKLPVKHMPTAPTPGPPHSSCILAPSARHHTVIGDVLAHAQLWNSFETQPPIMLCMMYGKLGSLPGVPNNDGITAVQPISATLRPNAATFGVTPGTSWMTMTAGPEPIRYTS